MPRNGMLSAVTTTRHRGELRVMPWWLVLLGLVASALLGWLVLDWLLGEANRAGQPDIRAQLRIDAIRTGLTVVAGTGGGLALLLAARRQWINERAQRHQEFVTVQDQSHRERVQAHTETVTEAGQRQQEVQARAAEHDATERRLTELYTNAIELLGNDKAAVRLGGLYALERLAQDNARQRATIVAVVCAYLRMRPPGDDAHEAEVRRTAQRLLTRHLNAEDAASYWPGIRLDLAGATLVEFDASGCTLVDADFSGALFRSGTSFAGATVSGRLRLGAAFETATFEGISGDAEIMLDDARFEGESTFRRADFGGRLSCQRARFADVSFVDAAFRQSVNFDGTHFGGNTSFHDARFDGRLAVEHAEFAQYAGFRSVRFDDMALFRWTAFRQDAYFEDAVFTGAANFARAEFHATASFEGVTTARPMLFDHARAATAGSHKWPPGPQVNPGDEGWLVLTDR
jgi:hypothetical protein